MKILITILVLFTISSCCPKSEQSSIESGKIKIEGNLSVTQLCDSVWIHRYDSNDILALKERAKSEEKQCDVMFFGSSSIRLWKTLSEDFAPLTVVNRGYGGATLRDLHYNYDIVMADYKPKAFVFYCDNDLRTKANINITVGELFDLVRMLFKRIETDYPGVPIYFLAMKHCQRREAIRDRQTNYNALMREFAEISDQVIYVDTCTPLLTPEGEIDASKFLDDKIHLNAKGYADWVKILRPMLIK